MLGTSVLGSFQGVLITLTVPRLLHDKRELEAEHYCCSPCLPFSSTVTPRFLLEFSAGRESAVYLSASLCVCFLIYLPVYLFAS